MKPNTSDKFHLAMTFTTDLYSLIDKANMINTDTAQDLKNVIDYTYSYERMAKAVMSDDCDSALHYLKQTNRLGQTLCKRLIAGTVEILTFNFKG
tara:strand:- start:6250 stop:6534 length:285 start_codon:yes stop_codon:yes gene_type:complete